MVNTRGRMRKKLNGEKLKTSRLPRMRKEVFRACLDKKVNVYYFDYENSTLTLDVNLVKTKTNYQAV